jgi:AraC-like DNA-binding protein
LPEREVEPTEVLFRELAACVPNWSEAALIRSPVCVGPPHPILLCLQGHLTLNHILLSRDRGEPPGASRDRVVSSSSDSFLPIRFCTDDLPERDRLAQWREVAGRTVMKVDMQPLDGEPFRCEAILRSLPGLSLLSFDTSPIQTTRTPALIADGNDDLVLLLSVHGTTVMSALGREATLGRGDATLISSADPSKAVIRTPSRFHCLGLPLARLSPLVSDIDAALASVIPGNVEALRLLSGYIDSLHTDIPLSTPELRRLAVTHICDLAALAIGATRDAAEMSRQFGVRAARLLAIKSDIAESAAKPDFSIDEVAARHRVSPRYIRRLFEGTGTTFTEYALWQRLALAHRMLSDPRYEQRAVSSIAFDTGFSDLSYFNRAFRQRFGLTPSDVRAAARREVPK